jgi:hypothetical protein
MFLSPDLVHRLRGIGAAVADDVLSVAPDGTRPARQLRVVDGRVFVRDARDGRFAEADWREIPVPDLLAYFAENSPVAAWLRTCGADLIQRALTGLAGH